MARRNRIDQCFAALRGRRQSALVPFLTAGDPDLDTTGELLDAAVRGGADLIELGVPFSDPTADGPAIQRSAARAIERGSSLPRILEVVSSFRRRSDVPLILFGYYNPIFHYGPQRFADDAKAAGADGLLVVDLPPEEADELYRPARKAGLKLIFLLAPTSDGDRVQAVLKKASGFLYFVSMTGVTGSKKIETGDVGEMVTSLRAASDLPIGVGFGITSAQEAARVASFADAVVVGSAIVRLIEESAGAADLPRRVESFIGELGRAVRGAAA